jgi:hypothetical protein
MHERHIFLSCIVASCCTRLTFINIKWVHQYATSCILMDSLNINKYFLILKHAPSFSMGNRWTAPTIDGRTIVIAMRFERSTSQIIFWSVTVEHSDFLCLTFGLCIPFISEQELEWCSYAHLRMAALRLWREASTLRFVMQSCSSLTVNNQRCWQNRNWHENNVMWFVTQQLVCKFILRDFSSNCSSESRLHSAVFIIL